VRGRSENTPTSRDHDQVTTTSLGRGETTTRKRDIRDGPLSAESAEKKSYKKKGGESGKKDQEERYWRKSLSRGP